MCGIAGIWGKKANSESSVFRSTRLLRHRGPDGIAVVADEHAALGHRRLSIVDLRNGGQPLYNEDRSVAVVYNGEIYNHEALRAQLAHDHVFASASDGEVLPHLLESEEPEAACRRLRGMFAVAAVTAQGLVLARDPLGIKPLYWSRTGDTIAFASELAAMTPLGASESVEIFPPGHVFTSRDGLRPYWALPDVEPLPPEVDIDTEAIGLLEVVRLAVRRRLMSDVPIGIFLSGGLDSSLIAALAVEALPGLQTFAVGTPDSPDLDAARRIAATLGTRHKEIHIDRDRIEAFAPTIVRRLESDDHDLFASAIPTFFLSQAAAKHVKVVLTGEGADELFAGYAYHRAYLGDPARLDAELRRSVSSLHGINLQRVDRMTMAHGIEARVPFLDVDVVRFALSVPIAHKIDAVANKIVLRAAAALVLPKWVVERPKAVFADGTGAASIVESVWGDEAALREFLSRQFRSSFPEPYTRLSARWQDGRVTASA